MYESYKPLRNRLRKYNLFSSLRSIYHYFQYLDSDQPLPSRLTNTRLELGASPFRMGLYQWELELLARELILNASTHAMKSIDNWAELARVSNMIKSIENGVWGKESKHEDDIIFEIVRIAHRQFPWQKGFTQEHVAISSRLFGHHLVAPLVLEKYNMTYHELLQISMALTGILLKGPIINRNTANQLNSVSPDILENYFNRFSLPIDELRETTKASQQYDINWAYSLNPLRQFPLIKLDNERLFCPIPTLLLKRATDAIYFDLVTDKKKFPMAFGPAFQDLIGDISKSSNLAKELSVLEEARYGAKSKVRDSVDWIVEDETASLFVECKSSRMSLQGKTDLTSHEPLTADLERMKKFALQLYSTLNDAMAGKYNHWKPNGNPVYPLIVTLEDWQTFGLHIEKYLMVPLKQELKAKEIDPAIVDQHPLTICSTETYSAAIDVMQVHGVEALMAENQTNEKSTWALATVIDDSFLGASIQKQSKLFEEEWAKLLTVTN